MQDVEKKSVTRTLGSGAWSFLLGTSKRGVGINLFVMLATQVFSTAIAYLLWRLDFSDPTIVIVYVLGVLLAAIGTTGRRYCLIASVISIVSCNYFFIEPRHSILVADNDYLGTLGFMFVVALITSYLMDKMRENAQASMQANLMAQNEQLRADLLRSVSHDLRTPLTSISGNADILLEENLVLSPEARKKLLQDIYDDATWLGNVMENLLAVTKLEDGHVQLRMEPELVDDVIEEALRHVSRDASKHNLVVTPSPELLLARMDARVIVQVIVNFVNNAITHTQEGSHITISTKREADMAAITVADNGPGISEDDKPHVFESFYTTSSGTTDSNRSVGLGLSLCKSIVEAHGGSIRVEDVVPHGAAFTFTLPIEEIQTDE